VSRIDVNTSPQGETTPQDQAQPAARQGWLDPRWRHFVSSYGFIMLFVLVILYFSLSPRTGASFVQGSTVRQIVLVQGVMVIITTGMVIPLVAGSFDLSVSAVAGVSAVTVASAVEKYHIGLTAGIVIALAIALVIGLVNGVLVARIGTSSFVTTLAMSTLLAGLLAWNTNSLPLTAVYSKGFNDFGTATIGGIPTGMALVIPVVAGAIYVLRSTPFGRYLEAIGSNARAAKLVGMPVTRSVMASFVCSALLGALAGILLTAQAGGADPGVGESYLFPAFTAVFLGMTTIKPGRANVLGTVLAVLFIAVSETGLTMAGASAWISDVFEGAALLVAVCISTSFARGSAAGRI
jgi:ribose transport system permease protein